MGLKTWVSGSDYRITSITVPALPYTLALWFKPHANPAAAWVGMAYSGPSSKYAQFRFSNGRIVNARAYDGTNVSSADSPNSATLDAWNHVACVFNTTTDRKVYLNAGTAGTDTTSIGSAAGSGTFYMGGLGEANTIGGEDGSCKIAYAAIWNIALSAGDVTSLQTLYPTSVQAANLVSYWDLAALPPNDTGSNNWDLTVVGSDSVVDNADLPSLTSGSSGSLIKRRAFVFSGGFKQLNGGFNG